MGDIIPDVLQSSLFSSIVQVSIIPVFLDQWRSITFNRFVLNMVKGHHLELRCCPPLFHNFRWFNIKAIPAYHSIIQKEVNEHFAKDAFEPSSGGASVYSNIFVVPKCMGGICPIFNLKHFNQYLHMPTFKKPTFMQIWLLIE